MKPLLLYAAVIYIVACADNVKTPGERHRRLRRTLRAVVWPVTVTSWFCTPNVRLPRLLNILWTVLIGGWFLGLLADRL